MVVKTREKLLDVARQLFARKGVENTTMNDIAEASDKGRRTVYTYFKSKRDIFNAIVERESEQLVENLRRVVQNPDATNTEKLREFLMVRVVQISPAVDRDGSPLRYLITGDFRKIEKIRHLATLKEQEIFDSIITAGIESGEFDPVQARRLPDLKAVMLAAVQTHRPDGHDAKAVPVKECCRNIIDFIIQGVAR